MSKRGENIYKRKDGRWEGRYIRDRTAAGKAVYGYVYARSYKEARQKLQEALRLPPPPKTPDPEPAEPIYFHVLAEEWFVHIRSVSKESTYMKYRNLWNSYILPDLGTLPFAEITQDVLEAYCSKLLSSGGCKGKGLSAKTVSDTLSLIRNIFRLCADRKIPLPCTPQVSVIKQHTKEMRILSLNEQQTLCSYIYSNLSLQNLGILLCLFTGIRIGELCALRWEDISFSENTLHIHQTLQRIQLDDIGEERECPRTKVIVTTPKSPCSIRTIPLPDELVLLMKSVQDRDTGYFLTGSDTKWLEPRAMQRRFKRLLKKCALEDINYHALRHTFATRCVELGFDVKSLSEILGHASVNITMNRYVHPSIQLKRENMQRLSSIFAVR